MKVHPSLIIFCLILASCGGGRRGVSAESLIGSVLKESASYGASEKGVALRICYALRSKNINYRAYLIGSKFKFNINESTCDSRTNHSIIDTTLRAPLLSQPIIFDYPGQVDFYSNVQTDQHGILENFCSPLQRGEIPSKTFLNKGALLELSFFSSGVDNIILRTAGKVNEKYVVFKEERFSVLTETTGNSLGRVNLVEVTEECSNGKVSSFTQQLIP